MSPYLIRPATTADEPFLWEMLYHALYAPEGHGPFPKEITREPDIAKYVLGWGKEGDRGFVAVDGLDFTPVGAAWIRLFAPEGAGYGYVGAETPELSVAVLPEHRNRGVGTDLLGRLISEARRHHPAVSLSVSSGNPAARLYRRLGFEIVGRRGDSLVMEKRFDNRQNSEVAASYDLWAATYDVDPNQTRERAAVVLRQRGLKLAGRDVIEVGCGTGLNTQWLAEQAATVLALDFSAGMLRQAQARVRSPGARFVRHDIRSAWPVADASADAVIAMLVLEHIERLEPIYAEAARALRVGGDLFLCELHPTRQMLGRQAEFRHPETGERELVAAFLHDVSEYVNEGLRARFELLHLGEWRDAGAPRATPPRLLSLHFRLTAQINV
jgi:ubiquinone/menaquinone biosynthesis C-methylase UbiE/GNAT superfamily N-acetyltransferase